MTNPFIYRKLSVLFLLFITFGNVYSKNKEMEQLFSRLDSVLTNSLSSTYKCNFLGADNKQ